MRLLKQFIKKLITENIYDDKLLETSKRLFLKYIEKFKNEFDNQLQISNIHSDIGQGYKQVDLKQSDKKIATLTSTFNYYSNEFINTALYYNFQRLKDYHGKNKSKKTDWNTDKQNYFDINKFESALNGSDTLLEFENKLNDSVLCVVHCSREQKAAMEFFVSSKFGKSLGAVLVSNKKTRGGYKYEYAVVFRRTNAFTLLVIPPFDKKRTRKSFGERDNQIVYITKDMKNDNRINLESRPYCILPIDKFIAMSRVCKTVDEFDVLAQKYGKAPSF